MFLFNIGKGVGISIRHKEPHRMQPIKKLIDGLVPDLCGCDYCILKLVCSSMFGSNPRELFQIKCVEMLKWELNCNEDDEIDISEVWTVWIDGGYAAAFANVYKEYGPDLHIHDMYNKIKEKAHESSG